MENQRTGKLDNWKTRKLENQKTGILENWKNRKLENNQNIRKLENCKTVKQKTEKVEKQKT